MKKNANHINFDEQKQKSSEHEFNVFFFISTRSIKAEVSGLFY